LKDNHEQKLQAENKKLLNDFIIKINKALSTLADYNDIKNNNKTYSDFLTLYHDLNEINSVLVALLAIKKDYGSGDNLFDSGNDALLKSAIDTFEAITTFADSIKEIDLDKIKGAIADDDGSKQKAFSAYIDALKEIENTSGKALINVLQDHDLGNAGVAKAFDTKEKQKWEDNQQAIEKFSTNIKNIEDAVEKYTTTIKSNNAKNLAQTAINGIIGHLKALEPKDLEKHIIFQEDNLFTGTLKQLTAVAETPLGTLNENSFDVFKGALDAMKKELIDALMETTVQIGSEKKTIADFLAIDCDADGYVIYTANQLVVIKNDQTVIENNISLDNLMKTKLSFTNDITTLQKDSTKLKTLEIEVTRLTGAKDKDLSNTTTHAELITAISETATTAGSEKEKKAIAMAAFSILKSASVSNNADGLTTEAMFQGIQDLIKDNGTLKDHLTVDELIASNGIDGSQLLTDIKKLQKKADRAEAIKEIELTNNQPTLLETSQDYKPKENQAVIDNDTTIANILSADKIKEWAIGKEIKILQDKAETAESGLKAKNLEITPVFGKDNLSGINSPAAGITAIISGNKDNKEVFDAVCGGIATAQAKNDASHKTESMVTTLTAALTNNSDIKNALIKKTDNNAIIDGADQLILLQKEQIIANKTHDEAMKNVLSTLKVDITQTSKIETNFETATKMTVNNGSCALTENKYYKAQAEGFFIAKDINLNEIKNVQFGNSNLINFLTSDTAKQVTQLTTEKAQLIKDKAILTTDVNTLTQQLQSESAQLAAKTNELKLSDDNNKTLQAQFDSLTTEHATLQTDLATTKNTLTDVNQERKKLINENNTLKSDKDSIVNKYIFPGAMVALGGLGTQGAHFAKAQGLFKGKQPNNATELDSQTKFLNSQTKILNSQKQTTSSTGKQVTQPKDNKKNNQKIKSNIVPEKKTASKNNKVNTNLTKKNK